MAHEILTLHVPDDSEIARLFEHIDTRSIRLENKGLLYRVVREPDGSVAEYDPERARAGMRAGAGTLTLDQGEQLKKFIASAREEGSRAADRP